MSTQLKNLSPHDMLSLDSHDILNFTGQQDFKVKQTSIFELEADGEFVIVSIDDYFLIAHNASGDDQIYICELFDGDSDKKIYKNDKFISHFKMQDLDDRVQYSKSENGLRVIDDEILACEYNNEIAYFNTIFIIIDETTEIYRGFEISATDLVI